MKMKTTIIGAGKIAALFDSPSSEKILTHAHAFSLSDKFILNGFYDMQYENAERAAKIWNCNAYKTLENAVKDADIVCCCVPDKYHFEILCQIATYPVKLVVAEKPVAVTMEEAKEIKVLYGEKEIPLLINYSRRFIKEFIELKETIREMGSFITGTAYYGKGITHNGSHVLNLLSFLINEKQTVKKAFYVVNDFSEHDISCDAVVTVGDKNFRMIAVDSRIVTVFEMDLLFEKARVRIVDGGTIIEIYTIEESKDYAGYYNYVLTDKIDVDYSGAMTGMVENIWCFLNDRQALLCDIEEGINVMRTCDDIKKMINE